MSLFFIFFANSIRTNTRNKKKGDNDCERGRGRRKRGNKSERRKIEGNE
jgi:hypothetical protein